MLGRFEVMLRAIVDDPDRRISDLPILSEAERRRALIDRNDTRAEIPPDASIPRAFEARALQSPEAIALVDGDRSLTYRELNARANQLARSLRGRGVGPEDAVALLIERSAEMAVAILATLKAGCSCFPLDTGYPRGRLAYMLGDSRAPLVLTMGHLAPRLPESSAGVICLDTDRDAIGREPAGDLEVGPSADQAAYLIYTSGSTGTPKGVVLTHRGLINHTLAAIDLYGLNARDRVLQFASLSFDISIEELFPSWCAGATVVLRPDDATLASTTFGRWVERQRITVLDLPTAFWHEWVEELADRDEAVPEGLRMLIVGGEKASSQARSTWLGAAGRASAGSTRTARPRPR